jgi:hypothetical protein
MHWALTSRVEEHTAGSRRQHELEMIQPPIQQTAPASQTGEKSRAVDARRPRRDATHPPVTCRGQDARMNHDTNSVRIAQLHASLLHDNRASHEHSREVDRRTRTARRAARASEAIRLRRRIEGPWPAGVGAARARGCERLLAPLLDRLATQRRAQAAVIPLSRWSGAHPRSSIRHARAEPLHARGRSTVDVAARTDASAFDLRASFSRASSRCSLVERMSLLGNACACRAGTKSD